jgi:hypothetical protein
MGGKPSVLVIQVVVQVSPYLSVCLRLSFPPRPLPRTLCSSLVAV